jgi:hypothetical protein
VKLTRAGLGQRPDGNLATHLETNMRIDLLATLSAIALCIIAPASVRAEEDHRELGAHEHGHGTLNIAVEENRVAMELEVPGMDIVGFEHQAATADQKAALERGKAELGRPLALFKVPAAARCGVRDVKVSLEAEHGHGHEHGGGKDDPAKGEDEDRGEREDHADDHDHDQSDGHNAFRVTYDLSCANPAQLTSIAFDYFKTFTGARNLTVNVVTAKAQSTYEVSRDKPVLDLGGVM